MALAKASIPFGKVPGSVGHTGSAGSASGSASGPVHGSGCILYYKGTAISPDQVLVPTATSPDGFNVSHGSVGSVGSVESGSAGSAGSGNTQNDFKTAISPDEVLVPTATSPDGFYVSHGSVGSGPAGSAGSGSAGSAGSGSAGSGITLHDFKMAISPDKVLVPTATSPGGFSMSHGSTWSAGSTSGLAGSTSGSTGQSEEDIERVKKAFFFHANIKDVLITSLPS